MLGPVQVLVIGVSDDDGIDVVVRSLAALPDDGAVRLLDAFALTITTDGEVVASAAGSAATARSLPLFAEAAEDSSPPTSAGDTWQLGDAVPPGTKAVLALLEHRWAIGLRESLVSSGAVLRHETWLDEEDRRTLERLLAAGADSAL